MTLKIIGQLLPIGREAEEPLVGRSVRNQVGGVAISWKRLGYGAARINRNTPIKRNLVGCAVCVTVII